MPLPSGLSAKQLVQMLSSLLSNEQQHWQPISYTATSEITGTMRDEVALWVMGLNTHYRLQPETANLAVMLFDKVLAVAKVRAKYLHVMAISCFYIAAKTLEEDEVIPTTLDLVRKGACGCTVSEVLRMELVILNKLNWNIKYTTAVDFLYTIHGILAWQCPQALAAASGGDREGHLGWLLEQLLGCLACHTLQSFRPATLAVTLLALSLQQTSPNWMKVVYYIQSLVKVDKEELMACGDMVSRFLKEKQTSASPASAPACSLEEKRTTSPPEPTPSEAEEEQEAMAPLLSSVLPPIAEVEEEEPCPKKRKGAPEDPDNIYEGIKRLYGDESTCDSKPAGLRTSCSMEFHPETEETSPSAATICAK